MCLGTAYPVHDVESRRPAPNYADVKRGRGASCRPLSCGSSSGSADHAALLCKHNSQALLQAADGGQQRARHGEMLCAGLQILLRHLVVTAVARRHSTVVVYTGTTGAVIATTCAGAEGMHMRGILHRTMYCSLRPLEGCAPWLVHHAALLEENMLRNPAAHAAGRARIDCLCSRFCVHHQARPKRRPLA